MRSHHLTECGRADALGARSRRRADRRCLLRKSREARRRAASCRRRPTFAHGAVGRSMTTTCAPRWPLSSRCATCWKASHICGDPLPWGLLSSAISARQVTVRWGCATRRRSATLRAQRPSHRAAASLRPPPTARYARAPVPIHLSPHTRSAGGATLLGLAAVAPAHTTRKSLSGPPLPAQRDQDL